MSNIDIAGMFESLLAQGYSKEEAFAKTSVFTPNHNSTKDELITEKDLKISNLELKEWINIRFNEVNDKFIEMNEKFNERFRKIEFHIRLFYLFFIGLGYASWYIVKLLHQILLK